MKLNVWECVFLIVVAAACFNDASAWAVFWSGLPVVYSRMDDAK